MTTREYGIQAIKDEAEALLDMIPKMDRYGCRQERTYRCKDSSNTGFHRNTLVFHQPPGRLSR